jgi:hypothetical protein
VRERERERERVSESKDEGVARKIYILFDQRQ